MDSKKGLNLVITVVAFIAAIAFLKIRSVDTGEDDGVSMTSGSAPAATPAAAAETAEVDKLLPVHSPQANEVEKISGPSVISLQSEYAKCFEKPTLAANFEALKDDLLNQKEYSRPVVSEENYELTSLDGKNLVVQHLPQEENEKQVRLFVMSATDGLPDRIKDFPQSNSEVSLRLKGALGRGQLKSKRISTTQSASDGATLILENTDGVTTKIHLMGNGFDFECKNQSCQCVN